MNERRPFTTIDVPIRLGQSVMIREPGQYNGEVGIIEEIRVNNDGVFVKVVGCDDWKGSHVCPISCIEITEFKIAMV